MGVNTKAHFFVVHLFLRLLIEVIRIALRRADVEVLRVLSGETLSPAVIESMGI